MLRSFTRNIPSRSSRLLRQSRATSLLMRPSTSIGGIRRLATSYDTFMQTNNANYIDEMYEAWTKDPSSVHVSWDAYFKNLNGGKPSATAFMPPPTLVPAAIGTGSEIIPATPSNIGQDDVFVHLKTQLLVRAYQVRGHLKAHIDPLERNHFGSWYLANVCH
ncbi:unnamed protein product [Ambrosiozyma monospora]|uniref:Unnamed protein product n=1 Tax=Ambrosiozyma monospora TaxID=43982 RepID=A0ACB5T4W7_AMBMO|nr:unnamed protein product [Ambrosiozyma monospora]